MPHRAEPARLNELPCVLEMLSAALLRPDLHRELRVAILGRHHGLAVFDVVGRRFLEVHVLAGLKRKEGDQRMPMIGGGVDDRVDGLVLENPSEVLFDSRRGFETLFLHFGKSPVAHGAVAVAQGDHIELLRTGEGRRHLVAAIPAANDARTNPVAILPASSEGMWGRRNGRQAGCGSKKNTA